MVTAKSIFFGSLLSLLCAVAFLTFMIGFSVNNEVSSPLDDPELNRIFGNLSTIANGTAEYYQTQRESYETDTPIAGSDGINILNIVSVLRRATSNVFDIVNVFFSVLASFGIGAFAVGIIIAILIIALILSTWRVLRAGE